MERHGRGKAKIGRPPKYGAEDGCGERTERVIRVIESDERPDANVEYAENERKEDTQ